MKSENPDDQVVLAGRAAGLTLEEIRAANGWTAARAARTKRRVDRKLQAVQQELGARRHRLDAAYLGGPHGDGGGGTLTRQRFSSGRWCWAFRPIGAAWLDVMAQERLKVTIQRECPDMRNSESPTMTEQHQLEAEQQKAYRLRTKLEAAEQAAQAAAAEITAARTAWSQEQELSLIEERRPDNRLKEKWGVAISTHTAATEAVELHRRALRRQIETVQVVQASIEAKRHETFARALQKPAERLHRVIEELAGIAAEVHSIAVQHGQAPEDVIFAAADPRDPMADFQDRATAAAIYTAALRLAFMRRQHVAAA